MSQQDDPRLVRYPASLADEYRRAGLWGSRTIAEEFHHRATLRANHPALEYGCTVYSYAELDTRSDQFAAGALELGLRPGDPVLLQVHNGPYPVIAWYGLLKAGLIPVCTLSLHRRHEISEISRRTRAVAHLVDATGPAGGFDLVGFAHEQAQGHPTLRYVLTIGAPAAADSTPVEHLGSHIPAEDARALVEQVQDAIADDDLAVFQLSGGTTGVPKVIPRLQAEYWYNATSYADWLGWDGTERVAFVGPLMHNAGIICGLHGPHAAGATLVLGSPHDPIPTLLKDTGSTDIVLGGAAYDVTLDPSLAEAHALRRVVLSGKKVPAPHFAALERLGVWAGQLFGMGEGLCLTTRRDAPRSVRADTVGTPLSPLDEVRVYEPGTEDPVPDGQAGELCCRGPYTLRGYYDAAEHNRRAFTSDGFYRTGDLVVRQDIEGHQCYSVEGRIKDLINRGGEKINAEEVEALLISHPDVTEAALVAVPDARLGERACAFLVGTRHLTLPEVRDHLDALGVAKYKWPERLEWLSEMPKANEVGKIDKKKLRALATAPIEAS
ncbi:(2,3-dihydroxybenzoyl)adenylate synthase [[Mycobacterium] crassicus]|uniref:AMP-binding protein n=1 Tax=[Mycobacterium] crassicus TaxID=2872309 RepID=A0ABU5XLU1_9MYCO|nr:AMP-binding protein [Mycolicibacter sp. MYC098]MEB3023143.1 AMP-binding protein [Mycolicibacter sp. MYC098]